MRLCSSLTGCTDLTAVSATTCPSSQRPPPSVFQPPSPRHSLAFLPPPCPRMLKGPQLRPPSFSTDSHSPISPSPAALNTSQGLMTPTLLTEPHYHAANPCVSPIHTLSHRRRVKSTLPIILHKPDLPGKVCPLNQRPSGKMQISAQAQNPGVTPNSSFANTRPSHGEPRWPHSRSTPRSGPAPPLLPNHSKVSDRSPPLPLQAVSDASFGRVREIPRPG